jgi:lipopolysaccharide transport system ATP-binding protein
MDTPVKRYSSGMYVHLAFAVAAHLEPEILLVDEVLTVGDAAFQKKCMGKMGVGQTKSDAGRTRILLKGGGIAYGYQI